jgi:hypothetical protein
VKVPLKVLEHAASLFPGTSMVLLGCAADGKKYDYCEVNLALYPAVGSVRLVEHGDQIYQLIPLKDPLELVKGPHRVITDENWNVSSVLASGRRMKLDSLQWFMADQRETESMRFLVLGYAALERDDLELASVCTLGALSKLAEAKVLTRGLPAHPSHLAEDLRILNEMSFFSNIADFDLPTPSNCKRRVERLVRGFGQDDGRLVRNKLEGLAHESRYFDCLFYSYWCLAKLLERDEALKGAFYRELGFGVEAVELREKLNLITGKLKEMVTEEKFSD